MLYEIHIYNGGDARRGHHLPVPLPHQVRNPNTFLYNTGPITRSTTPTWNRPQYYSVTRVEHGHSRGARHEPAVPPVNVGVRSTPNYAHAHRPGGPPPQRRQQGLRRPARRRLLRRPRHHLRPRHPAPVREPAPDPVGRGGGVNGVQGLNVHTIAIQVPITDLTRDGTTSPTDVTTPRPPSASGPRPAGASADLRRPHAASASGTGRGPGLAPGQPAVQRGHHADGREGPLERTAAGRRQASSRSTCTSPSWPACCRSCTRACSRTSPRTTSRGPTCTAILLTGIPAGVVPGFQNYTGPVEADMLRLNVAIPPTAQAEPARVWSLATWPASRTAGASSTTSSRSSCGPSPADHPAGRPVLHAGRRRLRSRTARRTPTRRLKTFPYLGTPAGGYQSKPGVPAAS